MLIVRLVLEVLCLLSLTAVPAALLMWLWP